MSDSDKKTIWNSLSPMAKEMLKQTRSPQIGVGAIVRFDFQLWTVAAIEEGGRLRLQHRTLQKQATAQIADVELRSPQIE